MAVFIVIVHSSELYRKMDAANTLKVLTLVLMLRCRDLYVCLYFCILSMVIPFLLLISFSVSSFDPSSLQSRQSGVLFFTLGLYVSQSSSDQRVLSFLCLRRVFIDGIGAGGGGGLGMVYLSVLVLLTVKL